MKPIIWKDLQSQEIMLRKTPWKVNTEGTFAKFATATGDLVILSVTDVEPADFKIGEEVWAKINNRWQTAVVKDRRERDDTLQYVVDNDAYWRQVVSWSFDPNETQIKKKVNFQGYIIRGDHEYVDKKEFVNAEDAHHWYENHKSYNDPSTDLTIVPISDVADPEEESGRLGLIQSGDFYDSTYQQL